MRQDYDPAFDPDDPSLEILLDAATITVVSMDDMEGTPHIIADIQPGARLVEDVAQLEFRLLDANFVKPHTIAQVLEDGVLRLIATRWKDIR